MLDEKLSSVRHNQTIRLKGPCAFSRMARQEESEHLYKPYKFPLRVRAGMSVGPPDEQLITLDKGTIEIALISDHPNGTSKRHASFLIRFELTGENLKLELA